LPVESTGLPPSSLVASNGELSFTFVVIFFAAGFFFNLPGSCSGGGFAFGPRERSRADRRRSIVDLPVLVCYDEIGREYFHPLLRAVGGIIVF
jgi:hypothetical protein